MQKLRRQICNFKTMEFLPGVHFTYIAVCVGKQCITEKAQFWEIVSGNCFTFFYIKMWDLGFLFTHYEYLFSLYLQF